MTFSIKTLSITALSMKWHDIVMLRVIMRSVVMVNVTFKPSMLNVIMLSVAFYLLLC
jgi:hypothetical protein